MKNLRDKIYDHCMLVLKERHAVLRQEWQNLQQAAASETKSSMGDKYETGREMLNLEKQKMATQLNEVSRQLKEMEALAFGRLNHFVQPGVVVETDKQVFFLAIPLGKIKVDGQEVFVLSAQSPLGLAMLQKKEGDTFGFGAQIYVIQTLT